MKPAETIQCPRCKGPLDATAQCEAKCENPTVARAHNTAKLEAVRRQRAEKAKKPDVSTKIGDIMDEMFKLLEIDLVCPKCGTTWKGPSFGLPDQSGDPTRRLCEPCIGQEEAERADATRLAGEQQRQAQRPSAADIKLAQNKTRKPDEELQ